MTRLRSPVMPRQERAHPVRQTSCSTRASSARRRGGPASCEPGIAACSRSACAGGKCWSRPAQRIERRGRRSCGTARAGAAACPGSRRTSWTTKRPHLRAAEAAPRSRRGGRRAGGRRGAGRSAPPGGTPSRGRRRRMSAVPAEPAQDADLPRRRLVPTGRASSSTTRWRTRSGCAAAKARAGWPPMSMPASVRALDAPGVEQRQQPVGHVRRASRRRARRRCSPCPASRSAITVKRLGQPRAPARTRSAGCRGSRAAAPAAGPAPSRATRSASAARAAFRVVVGEHQREVLQRRGPAARTPEMAQKLTHWPGCVALPAR